MKKFAIVTGALAFMIFPIGMLFKWMHWPGANMLIPIGIVVFAVLFVPSLAMYLYKQK